MQLIGKLSEGTPEEETVGCSLASVCTHTIHTNVVEAHGYGFRSTVVSGEHSRSKTSAIIAMYDVSTRRVSVRYETKSHS